MTKTPDYIPAEITEQLPTSFTAPLNKNDRCDRCNAQAYVRVHTTAGYEMTWCGHHWSANEEAMFPITAYVHDERGLLNPPVSVQV